MHLFIFVTLPSQLPHASVSQQVSRNPVLGLAFRPPTWSRINSCPIDLCRKASKDVLYKGVQSGDTVTTLVKSRPHPFAWQTQLYLIQVTLKSARSQHTNTCSIEIEILLLQSQIVTLFFRLVNLPVSPPSIPCISDLGSNQDRR
jgi:hypothetical protein